MIVLLFIELLQHTLGALDQAAVRDALLDFAHLIRVDLHENIAIIVAHDAACSLNTHRHKRATLRDGCT